MRSDRTDACDEVQGDLAGIVEGDPAVLRLHGDHLAQCDSCRDERHAASEAIDLLGDAGVDFVLPGDLEDRVLAALDARPPAIPTPSVERPLPQPQAEPPRPLPEPARVPRLLWLGIAAAAVVGFAVAAGLLFLGVRAVVPFGGPTSGRVATVVRAAGDGATGVEVRAPGAAAFAPAVAGAAVPAGASVRTDARTRARVDLDDGTSLVLDHATELRLDGETPRLVQLSVGEIVADVAHVDGGPSLTFVVPTGRVEVVGTKLALSASPEVASVRVARGEVRAIDLAGQSAPVAAGLEGILPKSGPMRVAPISDLAREMAWSDIAPSGEGEETALAGLGELRARRPGSTDDRERALRLARHDVRVRIAGAFAQTEVEEVFANDSGDRLEGIYGFPVPPGARIQRLALEVDGRLEEGAFVEKDRASKIFRGVVQKAAPRALQKPDIIWVPGPWRDPALLEWQRGGRVELRIFPIPAHGERRVVLGWTEPLAPRPGGRRYVYPLAHATDGNARADHFGIDVRLAGVDRTAPVQTAGYELARSEDGSATRLAFASPAFVPNGDVVVDFSPRDSGAELRAFTFAGPAAAVPARRPADEEVALARDALARDTRPYVAFAIRPEVPAWTESHPKDIVLVVDSSQSMLGERFERTSRLASAMVSEMDRLDRFVVLACDAGCVAMGEMPLAPSADAAREVLAFLGRIRPAGASDVAGALSAAAHVLDGKRDDTRELRVFYLGDGVASVGPRGAALAPFARSLAASSGASFSTVAVGDADAPALAAIARAGGGQLVRWTPGERVATAALEALETTYGASLVDAKLELPPGIQDVAPLELPTLRAGQEVIVTGRIGGDVRGEVVLRGTVGGRPYLDRYPIALGASTAAGNGFVPALWASSTIDRLSESGSADRARMIALSQAYGVLSPETSLLVLESDAMFRAYGVDRTRGAATWTGDEEAVATESTGLEAHPGPVLSGAMDASEGFRAAPMPQAHASARRFDPGDFGGGGAAASVPSAEAPRPPARMAAPRGRGPGRFMRRIWFRTAHVDRAPASIDTRAVFAAELALARSPDSRDKHEDLFRALSRAGNLARAEEIAGKWLGRDPLDPDALVALSDAVGRQGRRDEALRLLSGVVDIAPDDRALQERLAKAYDRAGMTARACAHRVALAAISPTDGEAAAAALACGSGRAVSMPERPGGDLVLDASWLGAGDLDLSIVTPRGTRLSWMGGRTSVAASDAAASGRERLSLRRLPAGTYLVEVSRVSPADRAPASGRLSIQALGTRRSIDFSLAEDRAVVARVVVRRDFRLVPLR